MNGTMIRTLILPLLATIVLAFGLPDGITKLLILPLCWWFFFRPLKRFEVIAFIGVCLLFTVMNHLALRNGVFSFSNQEFLLMPYHETVMWGFYLLYFSRAAQGNYRNPIRTSLAFWICMLLFAAPYGLVKDPTLLLLWTSGAIALALALHRERGDQIAVLCGLLVGVLFEQIGVHTGRWSYPPGNIGFWGVPLWSLPLWGGSAFFASRLFARLSARSPAAYPPA